MDFSLLANLPEHVHPMAHAKERDAEDHSTRAIENIIDCIIHSKNYSLGGTIHYKDTGKK